MSEKSGLIARLLATLTPHMKEDWNGAPGATFRSGLKRVAETVSDIGKKINEAHNLAWKAAAGAANEKMSIAEANFAKAENDRMDATLKQRVLDSKVRQSGPGSCRTLREYLWQCGSCRALGMIWCGKRNMDMTGCDPGRTHR